MDGNYIQYNCPIPMDLGETNENRSNRRRFTKNDLSWKKSTSYDFRGDNNHALSCTD